MKIIQRGINLRKTWPKPIICPKCGCVFMVSVSTDIIWSKTKGIDQMIVICPNSSCKFEQSLHSEKVNLVKSQIKGPWND